MKIILICLLFAIPLWIALALLFGPWYASLGFICFISCSFFEWNLHKHVMHKKVKFQIFGHDFVFEYAFRAHALVHHSTFTGDDESYEVQSGHEADAEVIPMAMWNGPVLIFLASIPSVAISWWVGNRWIAVTFVIACALYYLTYEGIHYAMHVKKYKRLVLATWGIGHIFSWLDGHHKRHHQKMGTNLNVVCPFADWVLGTLFLSPSR